MYINSSSLHVPVGYKGNVPIPYLKASYRYFPSHVKHWQSALLNKSDHIWCMSIVRNPLYLASVLLSVRSFDYILVIRWHRGICRKLQHRIWFSCLICFCDTFGLMHDLQSCISLGFYHSDVVTVMCLTYLPLMPHICVSDLSSIGLGNGFSSVRRPAITCTNADSLSVRPLGRNFS